MTEKTCLTPKGIVYFIIFQRNDKIWLLTRRHEANGWVGGCALIIALQRHTH